MMNEIEQKIKAQKDYTDRTGYPHFAPNDGICWDCGKQIYEKITMEKATTELITGCPRCNRSYCE